MTARCWLLSCRAASSSADCTSLDRVRGSRRHQAAIVATSAQPPVAACARTDRSCRATALSASRFIASICGYRTRSRFPAA